MVAIEISHRLDNMYENNVIYVICNYINMRISVLDGLNRHEPFFPEASNAL